MAENPGAVEAPRSSIEVDADAVRRVLTRLFAAVGLSDKAAARMAEALVEADLEGLPSHGVMQAEIYLKRLKLGSASAREQLEIVHDRDAIAVADSHHMMGHLAGEQAMAIAVEKAKRYGLGAVAVRRAFHLGAVGRYVRQAAEQGCIGMAMANTRPVMPAPGGAQPLVGTNPLAVSLPTPQEPPIVLDMATSAGTVARLRLAAKAGREIPDGWAVTAEGEPTNDPQAGLAGMLLPMAGPKGFGLSLIIDVMCGMLSSGVWGDDVSGLHKDLDKPFDASHFFLAINVAHFRPLEDSLKESGRAAKRVRTSKRAPGVSRIYTPGERRWEALRTSGGKIRLEAAQVNALKRQARELGVEDGELEAFSGAGSYRP